MRKDIFSNEKVKVFCNIIANLFAYSHPSHEKNGIENDHRKFYNDCIMLHLGIAVMVNENHRNILTRKQL